MLVSEAETTKVCLMIRSPLRYDTYDTKGSNPAAVGSQAN